MKKSASEFLIALAVHTVFLAFYLRAPLLSGKVDSLEQKPAAPPEALTDMSEMVYELQPALFVQTRLIKQGIFPAWSPFSQGGTPLLGKMQNAVFAPYHLPLYVLPLRWLPYILTLVIVIKCYLAFAFAYLYARSLGLGLLSGIFTATFYVYSVSMLPGTIFSWLGAGIYLPLMLLLIECYFARHRRLALMFWPWAVALAFFSGHFEGAFRTHLVAFLYFAAHLRNEKTPEGGKLKRLAQFGGLSLAGAAIAAVQIYPAKEYVDLSYTRIWHSLNWFTWQYDTISKHLGEDDLPLLAAGLGSLILFWFVLKRCLAAREPFCRIELGRKALAASLWAVGVACLANLGLEDSLSLVNFTSDHMNLASWLMGIFLLVFAFWGWSREDQPYGLRILGGVLIGSILVLAKTPPLSNLLVHLPMVKEFHNASHRWEFSLALAALCAAALERLKSMADREERRKAAARLFAILCVFALGTLASQPIKEALLGLVSTSTPPALEGQPENAGGIMGPERQFTYARAYSMAGWVPSLPSVSSIEAGLLRDARLVASVPASAELSGGRLYFRARIALPDIPVAQNLQAFARVRRGDGSEQMLRGALVEARRARGGSLAASCLLLAFFLALPAVLLYGPRLAAPACVLLLALCALQYKAQAIGADQIPYPMSGVSRLKEDADLFRISSLRYNFLQADYANVYGLSDLRTGGDNLDVLTMIHFFAVAGTFLSNPGDPAAFATGLKLLGLANVKYLLDHPQAKLDYPGLETIYRGPDLTIARNKYAQPRAVFYEKAAYWPVADWTDWKSRGKFLGPIAGLLARKDFDWKNTLLLHDPPDSRPDADAADAKPSSVRVAEYLPDKVALEVDAAKPGFVFLSDNDFPGWHALLNGEEAKILRSWITFRAVQVPKGKSSLVFLYRPFGLRLAALACAALSFAWLALYRRYRLDKAAPPAALPSPPQKKKKAALEEPRKELEDCARLMELLTAPLIGAGMLFWTAWSAFVYRGGAVIPWTARSILAGVALMALKDWARIKKAPHAPLP